MPFKGRQKSKRSAAAGFCSRCRRQMLEDRDFVHLNHIYCSCRYLLLPSTLQILQTRTYKTVIFKLFYLHTKRKTTATFEILAGHVVSAQRFSRASSNRDTKLTAQPCLMPALGFRGAILPHTPSWGCALLSRVTTLLLTYLVLLR